MKCKESKFELPEWMNISGPQFQCTLSLYFASINTVQAFQLHIDSFYLSRNVSRTKDAAVYST